MPFQPMKIIPLALLVGFALQAQSEGEKYLAIHPKACS